MLLLRQWVRPSVLIGEETIPPRQHAAFSPLTEAADSDQPLAFVAVCSNEPLPSVPGLCQFDTSFDFPRTMVETERTLNMLRIDNYTLTERYKALQASDQEATERRDRMRDRMFEALQALNQERRATVRQPRAARAERRTRRSPQLESIQAGSYASSRAALAT